MTDRNITRSCKAVQPSKKHNTVKLTTEIFIERAIAINGDRYDYSKVDYQGWDKKVIILCKTCNKEFEQIPNNHISHKNGCPNCFGKNRLTTKEFIRRAKLVHGDRYNYSKTQYFNNRSKVVIVCSKHGEFWQVADNHMKGVGCGKCANETRNDNARQPFSWFLEKANKKHNNKYQYDELSYTSVNGKVRVYCELHGWFEQNAKSHLYIGHGCRQCGFLNSGFNRSSFKERCNQHKGIGRLYVIKCFDDNEIFYKVGITSRTVKVRYAAYSKLPYKFVELFNIDGEPQFIYDLEVRLHSLLKKHHYQPLKEFKGSVYECFSHIPKSVIKLLKDLENTPQLQLIA